MVLNSGVTGNLGCRDVSGTESRQYWSKINIKV